MKLPLDSEIREEKLTEYLLKPRERNDKSKFLTKLGYGQTNWQELREDIRTQILPHEAFFAENTDYGDIYEIKATLTGPSGESVKVLTIWMQNPINKRTHLVTLYPAKEA